MVKLVGNTYWEVQSVWRQRTPIFWFLRAKAKGFGPFSREGRITELPLPEKFEDFDYEWEVEKKVKEWNEKIKEDMTLISQAEWSELKAWLKNNPIDSINIDDLESMEDAPSLGQIIGWEFKSFLNHIGEPTPDYSIYDRDDPDWEENWRADKASFEEKLLNDFKLQKSLILNCSSPQEYFSKVWNTIFNNDDGQVISVNDKIVELFFKVVEQKVISDIYLSHLSFDVVLAVVLYLVKSSKKYCLSVLSEDFFVNEIVFILGQVVLENLVCAFHQEESGFENKRAILLEFRGSQVKEEQTYKITSYDLACLICPQGTQVIDKRLRENLVTKMGLHWVISSFPNYGYPLEEFWKSHKDLPQWLFFDKDYKGNRINFFNSTSWNSNDGIDGKEYYLFGLLERWDADLQFDGASNEHYEYFEEMGESWRSGIVNIDMGDIFLPAFSIELNQERTIDKFFISKLGVNWINNSKQQVERILVEVAKKKEFLIEALKVGAPELLPDEALSVLRMLRSKGKGSLNSEEIELLSWVWISFYYPTGILTSDFRWRYLSISKERVIDNEGVLKQYFWQSEANRKFFRNSGGLGDIASIEILDRYEEFKNSSGGIPIINRKVLYSDGFGIDFEKVDQFIALDQSPKERIISEPVVLGFMGHRGFPIWFEQFDPDISPYKRIYLSEQICVIKPKQGMSVRALWDSLIYSVSHADGFHWDENWWVFTEFTNKDKWLEELNNIQLEDVDQIFSDREESFFSESFCKKHFSKFEPQRDLIAVFLRNFTIKPNRNETFESFCRFLEEALKTNTKKVVLNETVTVSTIFDKKELESSFFPIGIDGKKTYLITDLNNISLLIWNRNQLVGAVVAKAPGLGLKNREIANYAGLASFIYKVWQDSTNTIIELSGAEIAHKTATPYANIKTTLNKLSKYLDQQGMDKAASILRGQISESLEELKKLESMSQKARQFQKAKAKGEIEDVDMIAIIRNCAGNKEVEIEGAPLSGKLIVRTYRYHWEEIIFRNFIDNGFANSLDGHCKIKFIEQKNRDWRVQISNFVKDDFNPEILKYYGRETLGTTTGGSGFGVFISCRTLDALGSDWNPTYEEECQRFAIEFVLKGE